MLPARMEGLEIFWLKQVRSHQSLVGTPLARISEGASQSWCSPAGEGPARVSPSKAPGSE